MNSWIFIAVGYLTVLVVNILIFRYNRDLGGWLAMLADSRHGRLSNIIALTVLFFPPIVYLILLLRLYGSIQKRLKHNP